MNLRAYKLTVMVLLCVSILLAWRYWVLLGQTTWFCFIDKQCVITQGMIDRAPSLYGPEDLAPRLRFLIGYYNGSIHKLSGSYLESVVRRDYERTLTNAVIMFRSLTTNDLGSDPKAWIQKHGN